ncbi:hypothetical protein EGW08_003866, partial [Elysia chlorotica]
MAKNMKEGVSDISAPSLIHKTNSEPSPMSSHQPVTEKELDLNDSSNISHQLMYSEKFAECYKKDKLKIVGKETCATPQTFQMPQNSVLSRIKQFLPQLSQANKNTASDIASSSDQQNDLTIEPFTLDSDESDDDDEDDDDTTEERDVDKNCVTKLSADQNFAPFVEMNVALVPPEVLSMFDDDDSDSSSDESASETKTDNSI